MRNLWEWISEKLWGSAPEIGYCLKGVSAEDAEDLWEEVLEDHKDLLE